MGRYVGGLLGSPVQLIHSSIAAMELISAWEGASLHGLHGPPSQPNNVNRSRWMVTPICFIAGVISSVISRD